MKHTTKKHKSKHATLTILVTALAGAMPAAMADQASDAKKAKAAKKEAEKAKAAEAAAASALAAKKLQMSFWGRLDMDFREQMGTPVFVAPEAPVPDGKNDAKAVAPAGCTRRGFPAPLDGPPYPTGEWQIGGTAVIGDPGIVSPSPIMQALYDGPYGEAIKKSRIQFYGWEDVSANTSTSHNTSRGQNNNFPEVYDLRSNKLEQNQLVMYLERVPDECQTDYIDWGFRFSAVYGLDYRYMISRGFLDSQLLKSNKYYGWDMPMMYIDMYIPWIAQGMNIRVGRIISEADIEAQLAPNNPMSSHSLLYGFDPYTQWGVFTTTKLNKNWTLQLGVAAGNDVTPWQSDPGRQVTGTVMLQWISNNNKDSIYGGANAFNDARFGYNNIQQYVATWSHKFNEKIWTTTEGWYMYQTNATTAPSASVPYNNAFYPTQPGQAHEWAILNYTMFRMGPGSFFTVRNEVFDDVTGQRTGTATIYSEHSIGITWWPNKMMTVRPELRYDRSYDKLAFDNQGRKNQFTAQMDVIFHF
jgi:hypothetical protein